MRRGQIGTVENRGHKAVLEIPERQTHLHTVHQKITQHPFPWPFSPSPLLFPPSDPFLPCAPLALDVGIP